MTTITVRSGVAGTVTIEPAFTDGGVIVNGAFVPATVIALLADAMRDKGQGAVISALWEARLDDLVPPRQPRAVRG